MGPASEATTVRGHGLGVLALLGVLLFWAGVVGAGALVEGYSSRDDYISSLAGRGSPVAVLAIGALAASATAHLATAWAVGLAWRSRLGASALGGAALAVLAVAAFRQSCPAGPSGCGLTDRSTRDWVDTVHGGSVVAYALLAVAAMLVLGIGALWGTASWPRWLGLVSWVFAAGSVVLVGQVGGEQVGVWQRAWVANNLTWLLVVAGAASLRGRAQRRPPGIAAWRRP